MVLKASKRGLNTGNTIRRGKAIPGSTRYGYVKVDASQSYDDTLTNLAEFIPYHKSQHCGVEYSLKKRQGWMMQEQEAIDSVIEEARDDDRVHLKVFVHEPWTKINRTATERMFGPKPRSDVKDFYSSDGPLEAKHCSSTMVEKEAMRPKSDLDHLSRLERRKLKKSGQLLKLREQEEAQATTTVMTEFDREMEFRIFNKAPVTSLLLNKKNLHQKATQDVNFPQNRRKHHRRTNAQRDRITMDYDYDEDSFSEEENSEESNEYTPDRTRTATIANFFDGEGTFCAGLSHKSSKLLKTSSALQAH